MNRIFLACIFCFPLIVSAQVKTTLPFTSYYNEKAVLSPDGKYILLACAASAYAPEDFVMNKNYNRGYKLFSVETGKVIDTDNGAYSGYANYTDDAFYNGRLSMTDTGLTRRVEEAYRDKFKDKSYIYPIRYIRRLINGDYAFIGAADNRHAKKLTDVYITYHPATKEINFQTAEYSYKKAFPNNPLLDQYKRIFMTGDGSMIVCGGYVMYTNNLDPATFQFRDQLQYRDLRLSDHGDTASFWERPEHITTFFMYDIKKQAYLQKREIIQPAWPLPDEIISMHVTGGPTFGPEKVTDLDRNFVVRINIEDFDRQGNILYRSTNKLLLSDTKDRLEVFDDPATLPADCIALTDKVNRLIKTKHDELQPASEKRFNDSIDVANAQYNKRRQEEAVLARQRQRDNQQNASSGSNNSKTQRNVCSACHGTGKIHETYYGGAVEIDKYGNRKTVYGGERTCPMCGGTGYQ